MVFHRSLSDNKSPQVTRTLLSILADLNNAVVWMVSTCPLISTSSGPYTNHSVTVPRAPITIGRIVTFTFHIFFQSPGKVKILIPLFTFFNITLYFDRTAKSSILQVLFFLLYFFFFFVDYYKVWSSGRELVNRLYLKIPL